ncbi:MAG: hypothetical protein Q4F39_07140 [Bacteroidia bacterium]|nr:hypothetical protein [Bacteroidia bacterium]
MEKYIELRVYKFFAVIILLVSIVGCSKETNINRSLVDDLESNQPFVPDMSGTYVINRDHKVFADMRSFFYGDASTKSSISTQEPLEGFLDRSKSVSRVMNGCTYTEIPFKDEYSSGVGNITFSLPSTFSQDSLSSVKISLFDCIDNKSKEHFMFVVTMIPYPEFDSAGTNADYSLFDIFSDFRGILIFSEPDGTYCCCREYLGAVQYELVPVDPSTINGDKPGRAYLTFPSELHLGTKSLDKEVNEDDDSENGELVPAWCVESLVGDGCCGGVIDYADRSYQESFINSFLYNSGEQVYNNNSSQSGPGGSSSISKIYPYSRRMQGLSVRAKRESDLDKFEELLNSLGNVSELDMLISSVAQYAMINIDDASGSIKASTKSYTITINYDAPNGAIIEELFHVYQNIYDNSWQKGDKEFEAKVFNALLLEFYGKFGDVKFDEHYLTDGDYYLKLSEYYKTPNDITYSYVTSYLGRIGYYANSYPISNMSHLDRIKHIKKLLKK